MPCRPWKFPIAVSSPLRHCPAVKLLLFKCLQCLFREETLLWVKWAPAYQDITSCCKSDKLPEDLTVKPCPMPQEPNRSSSNVVGPWQGALSISLPSFWGDTTGYHEWIREEDTGFALVQKPTCFQRTLLEISENWMDFHHRLDKCLALRISNTTWL